MTNATEKFLTKLERDVVAYCTKKDLAESRFGREVANNTEIIPRLRKAVSGGGSISSKTLIAISKYMDDHK